MAFLVMGLNHDEGMTLLKYVVPPIALITSLGGPYLVMRWIIQRAFTTLPGDAPDSRLQRLLKAPSLLAVLQVASTLPGAGTITVCAVVLFGKSPWIILWAVVVLGLQIMLLTIVEHSLIERTIQPYAVQEFHRLNGTITKGSGVLWPRQSWYLPYAFGVFVANTLAVTLTIFGRQSYEAYISLMKQSETMNGALPWSMLQQTLITLAKDFTIPTLFLGGYLLLTATLSAWLLARRQKEGAESVAAALEGLAQGKPRLPEWVSTDEIGDLAAATARVFEQLRSFSMSLRDSALALQSSARQLGLSTSRQSEVLTVQASALQETQVTTEEIKNTSRLASNTAGNILNQTERAQSISASGELAIQEGMTGLEEIGAQVRDMATSIKSLDEQARQIARITSMVKDLADQSNMLALNAAIEAVRSGESGKGFGVVAKEIRALADQSIRATQSIRTILQNIGTAIAKAALLTEKGSQRVETSIQSIRNFSSQVQQISGIVRDNANSVRQIAAAVTQQDAGIVQITQAVGDMSRVMDQTMNQLRASEEAIEVVRQVAQQVTGFVGQYGWSQDPVAPPANTNGTAQV
jgi:methyl-accepting chemotaxis protein